MATTKLPSQGKDEEAIERVKKILFFKGRHSSETLNLVVKDFNLLSKPNCKSLNKKNDINPFEDINSVEFLGSKNDCGLFVFASHSKKRPNNLVIGRLYEEHLLDMYEFGIKQFQSIEEFPGNKKAFGSKPLMIFLGEQWQQNNLYKNLQNLFLDFFRGFKADKFCLTGIDHIISCSASENIIYIRTYYVNYSKVVGSTEPALVLRPMGPFLDLEVRRTQLASDDLWKLACRKPKNIVAPKVKNVEKSIKGDKLGRIHMKKQNLDDLHVRRSTALRGTKRVRDSEENGTNSARSSSNSSNKRPKKDQ